MNAFPQGRAQRYLPAAVLSALLVAAHAPVFAAPGAHGPNGEHLDAPTAARAASALPRIEASSEAFELFAELRTGELAIVVDRYASNEPVLGAKLEVESGSLKAVAAFRAEQGDYVVTDAALLKALAAPGEHGLVFTLVAGPDSDLLDGKLVNAVGGAAAAAVTGDHGGDHHGHGHDHELERAAWTAAGVAALGLIGSVAWWRQRRREAGKPQGAL
jgi:hypothetical protein